MNEGGRTDGEKVVRQPTLTRSGEEARCSETELRRRLKIAPELVSAARVHLETLHTALGGHSHVVAVCDAEGVVLLCLGTAGLAESLAMAAGCRRAGHQSMPVARALAAPPAEPVAGGELPSGATSVAAAIRQRERVAGAVEIALAGAPGEAAAEVLAAYAAGMIGRELEQRNELLRFDSLRAIEQLTEAALSHLRLDDLLRAVLVHLRDFVGADTAAVMLASEDGRKLSLRAALGLEQELAGQLEIAADEGVSGQIAAARGTLYLPDLRQVEVVSPVLRGQIRSLLGAPLRAEERLLGVVYVGTRRERRFTQLEAEQFKLIADRLALTVDHARLYQGERAARRQAQQAERRFRELVHGLNAIVWEADAANWNYTFVSRRAEAILGYPLQRWLEPGFWQTLIHPDDRELVVRGRRQVLETGEPGMLEYRALTAAGNVVWMRGLLDATVDDLGTPLQLRGLMLDITQQRQADLAVRRLAAIVEGSDDAIFTKDLDGIILSWNPGAQKMYGWTPAEIVGRPVTVLAPPEKEDEIRGFMARLRRGEAVEHVETVRLRKDGARRDVSLAISPMRDESGAIVGGSTIARDITDRKRSEQALRQTEKLAATGRLAASIAHEINNPMASVTNLLYLLRHNPSLDAGAQQYVSIAQEELQRIAHITRQMLGFYREAEAPVAVNLSEVLENVLALYARKIKLQGIQVEKRIAPTAAVEAYPGEMRQVFSNLVVNALEVSPDGAVLRLSVRPARELRAPYRPGVRVTVCDSGSGIQPQHRKNIFEPFFTTKGERGTGLGLWVSNGIVRKHGGFIRVRSSTRPGHSGTCFSVFLPHQGTVDAERSLLKPVAAEKTATEQARRRAPRRRAG